MFDNLVSSPTLSKLLTHKLISPFTCKLSYLELGYLRLR